MRIAIVAVAVLAIGVLTAVPTAGQQFFTAIIGGAQVVPATGSPGTGFGCVALNATSGTIDYNIMFSGLLAPETVSHFHGPAPAGSNAGVQIGLPLGSPKIGVNVPITAGQQTDLMAGLLYINIHSAMFPGGEIRGQVLTSPTPCQTVPVEESTWGQIKELYRAEA